MRTTIFIYTLLFHFLVTGQEEQKFVIKGQVTGKITNTPLSNVNLICNETGTITNKKGMYRLRLDMSPNTTIQLIASHQGYKNDTTFINLENFNTIIKHDIELKETSTSLLSLIHI